MFKDVVKLNCHADTTILIEDLILCWKQPCERINIKDPDTVHFILRGKFSIEFDKNAWMFVLHLA